MTASKDFRTAAESEVRVHGNLSERDRLRASELAQQRELRLRELRERHERDREAAVKRIYSQLLLEQVNRKHVPASALRTRTEQRYADLEAKAHDMRMSQEAAAESSLASRYNRAIGLINRGKDVAQAFGRSADAHARQTFTRNATNQSTANDAGRSAQEASASQNGIDEIAERSRTGARRYVLSLNPLSGREQIAAHEKFADLLSMEGRSRFVAIKAKLVEQVSATLERQAARYDDDRLEFGRNIETDLRTSRAARLETSDFRMRERSRGDVHRITHDAVMRKNAHEIENLYRQCAFDLRSVLSDEGLVRSSTLSEAWKDAREKTVGSFVRDAADALRAKRSRRR